MDPTTSTRKQQTHFHHLPEEVRRKIFDRTLLDASTRITISPSYLPPSTIQIHASSRAYVAPLYYGTSTFVLTGSYEVILEICHRWLSSLPREHIAMIRNIEIAMYLGLSRYSPLFLHSSLRSAGFPVDRLCVSSGSVSVGDSGREVSRAFARLSRSGGR